MENRKMRIRDGLFVSLALGLAWSVRGHFGHEHGAAWAGAVASLAVLLVANRTDWNRRAPVLAALGALGWGVGGIMSYGLLVGYGRSLDFGNVYYGLLMLAVVGGLYGFLGGGLLGLGLESGESGSADWASLLSLMVAGAILLWGLLISQLGWRMTPPRSELWAGCLGAALALAWFLHRNHFPKALRLASYTALGAAAGFAVGNVFQTAGSSSGLHYNWWNVMEFTLGFGGGLGLAFGVFTRKWPMCDAPSRGSVWMGWGLLFVIIPAVNVIQAFSSDRMSRQVEQLGIAGDGFAMAQRAQAWVVVAAGLVVSGFFLSRMRTQTTRRPNAAALFLCCLLSFVLLGHVRKALLHTGFWEQPEQGVYWLILLALAGVWMSIRRAASRGGDWTLPPEATDRWSVLVLGLVLLLAVLAGVSIQLHDGLPGAHMRF